MAADPEFDLSEARGKDRRKKGSVFIVTSGAGMAFALMGVYLLYLIPTKLSNKGGLASPLGVTFVLLAVFAEFIAARGILTALIYLPGADRIRVGNSGVELSVDGQITGSWGWSSPNDRFLLRDASQNPNVRRYDYPAYYISGPGRWSRSTALTKAAFETVLLAARQHGARIVSKPALRRSIVDSVVLYEVSGP